MATNVRPPLVAEEVMIAGEQRDEVHFVNEEAPKIHPAFGGLKLNEDGQLGFPAPYKNLQKALQEYVPLEFGITISQNPTKKAWNDLFDKAVTAEEDASKSENGILAIFSQMFVTVGENSDIIDPWISLIPDPYGLAVVKSAILIVLKVAQKHAEKRQAIFNGFLEIREVIGNARLKRSSFVSDPNVCKSAGHLYETIVKAIEELMDAIVARKHSKLLRKFRKSKEEVTQQGPEEVLKSVRDAVKVFQAAVDACRDGTIQRMSVEVKTLRFTAIEIKTLVGETRELVSEMKEIASQNDVLTREVKNEVDEVHTTLRIVQMTTEEYRQKADQQVELLQNRQGATEKLVELLAEERKKRKLLAAKARRLFKQNRKLMLEQQSHQVGAKAPSRHSKPVISLERLFQILSASSPDQIPASDEDVDLEFLVSQGSDDLEMVLAWTANIDPIAQGQASSVFNQDRFFEWLGNEHPDMLLIDGNILARGLISLEKISAMSLLCANFILSIADLEPSYILTHFHCGLHCLSGSPWYGPKGLIRSVIIQILVALGDRGSLDLNFLNRRSSVQLLENHHLDSLCEVLHELVTQFHPGTTVFLIIDGVSFFDLDNGLFKDLEVVIRCLQSIVEDDELCPKFKVMITTPSIISWRLRKIVNPEYYLSLSSRGLNSRMLSERRVKEAISRPLTPLMGSSQSMKTASEMEDEYEIDYND
ncbi:hypothetical protein V8E51_010026 [Hyaloscypha variabilis]